MGRVGFEPTKSVTSDLQSDPFGRSGTDPLTMYTTQSCVFCQYI